MLYLIMLMSDIDFSRIGAKVSDKGPPSRWQARGPSLFGWTMETMRNVTKTRSEFEQADGIRWSETPERMAALREAQPFVDQGGHPLILERNERTDSQLPGDRLGFPRIPAQEIGQRERLGHADRSAREESLECEEVLSVRGIGLVASFEDGPPDEVRPRADRISLVHGRALRTRAGGYSFCREIIRQMTKFPATVEIGGERNNSRIAAVSSVSTSEADDLAVPLEGRAPADIARLVGLRSRGPERIRGVRRRRHADGPWRSRTKSLADRSGPKSGEVLEGDHRRIAARSPGDASSRMGAAATEVQSPHGRPVAGPSRHRSEGEQLVRGHVGLIDAATGEAPLPLHVER